MSEQNSGAQGEITDGTEPSMEDILASIRKIIADDMPEGETASEPVKNTVIDEVSELVVDPAQEIDEVEAVAEESVFDLIHDTDPLPAQVTDLQVESFVESKDLAETTAEVDSDNIFDLIDDTSEVPQSDDAPEAEGIDLDSILASVVDDVAETQAEPVIDPVADLVVDEVVAVEPEVEDPDLTLVKSLMADLTEPVETAGEPAEDVVEADISEEGDILDAILDGALEDELAMHEADLAIPPLEPEIEVEIAAEPEVAAEPIMAAESETAAEIISEDDDGLSLSDIAAAAEEDAAMVAATTAMVKESPKTSKKAAVQNTDNQETIPMAKASKKEVIIDEVTETATADVFASLTKAVEDKAVVEERGDRIGDLVMEALRPMLKEWLDKNLKTIVERAVTKEVKRISSGK